MRAVDHDKRPLFLFPQLLLGIADALGVVIRTSAAASQDDEAVFVAARSRDRGQALLGDAHEMMSRGGGTDGVDGDAQAPVGAILEPDREREPGRQFAVQLRLGRAGADGAERDEVGQKLRRDGVEHLAGDRDAGGGEVAEELARQAQALVDLEGLVDVRIVDQALPAHRRSRLLEVGSHDDAEVGRQPGGDLSEPTRVLERGLWVVDGAGAADDKQPVVVAGDDGCRLLAALYDGALRVLGLPRRVSEGSQIGGAAVQRCSGAVVRRRSAATDAGFEPGPGKGKPTAGTSD